MPLFGKFNTKRAPTRKFSITDTSKDFETNSLDDENIRLNLGDVEYIFDNGQWISESGIVPKSNSNNPVLKKEIKILQEENNLLRLKFDVLLDTVTEKICELETHKKRH